MRDLFFFLLATMVWRLTGLGSRAFFCFFFFAVILMLRTMSRWIFFLFLIGSKNLAAFFLSFFFLLCVDQDTPSCFGERRSHLMFFFTCS